MKLALTALYIKDMQKNLDFYHTILEMPILHRNGDDMVVLGIEGEPGLELIAWDQELPHSGYSVGFEVENLDALKEKLTQSGYPIDRKFHRNGAILSFLKGPNGEDVELIAR